MIMFHPEVKSQRKHSETTSRMVTYDVFLTVDVCRCWCSHVFCLNEKMVWRNVYAIVAKAYHYQLKLHECEDLLTDVEVKTTGATLVASPGSDAI
jgi:hypothetical protein